MITKRTAQRSGLPLMLAAAAILVIELVIILFFGQDAGPNDSAAGRELRRPAETVRSDTTPGEERVGEAAVSRTEEAEEPPIQDSGTTHTVASGNTLYGLARRYWSDGRLWPFAYYPNESLLPDPDVLRTGQVLDLPNLTDSPVAYTRRRAQLAALAHLSAYDAYRRVGESMVAEGIRSRDGGLVRAGRRKQEKARWVLYAAGWFVPTFPEGYTGEIQSEDLQILYSYQDRFGPPFADR